MGHENGGWMNEDQRGGHDDGNELDEKRNIIVPEPQNHIDANEARRLVEASRLNLGDVDNWLGPLYRAIWQCADQGRTEYDQILHSGWKPPSLHGDQLCSIITKLRDDGFMVDQGGDTLTIRWGRPT